VVPVVHLVLHFGHLRLALAYPDAAAVPVGPQEHDLPDGAVVDPFDALLVVGRVATLEADAHLQPLFVGHLAGFHQRAEAGGVDAAGLLHEHVLAGLDRRRINERAEAGRRGRDDHVYAAVDRLLEGIQSGEHPLGGNVDALGRLLAEPLGRPNGLGLEGVGHGHDLHAFVGGHAVADGAAAAPAAADQRHLDLVAAGGVCGSGDAQLHSARQGGPGRDHARTLEKLSTRRGFLFAHLA
jgi:hypothetical protein